MVLLTSILWLAAPPGLEAWSDYQNRQKDALRCPQSAPCVLWHEASLRVDLDEGKMRIRLRGEHLGARRAQYPLIAGVATFSVEDLRNISGSSYAFLNASNWLLSLEPGVFDLEVNVSFAVQDVLLLPLLPHFGNVVITMKGGSVELDPNLGVHGGTLSFKRGSAPEAETIQRTQVSRRFDLSKILSFRYRVQVAGLTGPAQIKVPLLGTERISKVSDNIATRQEGKILIIPLSPAQAEVTIEGFFETVPQKLEKESIEPEYWAIETDPRTPAVLQTDATEIDPKELDFGGVGRRVRAFYFEAAQGLTIRPMNFEVEKQEDAPVALNLGVYQNQNDTFDYTLDLVDKERRAGERIRVNLGGTAIYTASGDDASQSFLDGEDVSLRFGDGRLGRSATVRWQRDDPSNVLLSFVSLNLLPQSFRTQRSELMVHLLPGFVPLWTRGAESSRGDLSSGFHIFGFLFGLFAFFLARAARFPFWLQIVVGVIFLSPQISLGGDYPIEAILVLMALAAVAARLPDRAMTWVQRRIWARWSLKFGVVSAVIVAMFSAGDFAKHEINLLLNPWSESGRLDDTRFASLIESESKETDLSLRGYTLQQELNNDEMAEAPAAMPQKKMSKGRRDKAWQNNVGQNAASNGFTSNIFGQSAKSGYGAKLKAKKAKPVSLRRGDFPLRGLGLKTGAIAPGAVQDLGVWVAGPILRGLFIILNLGVLLSLFLASVRPLARLRWGQAEEVSV